MAKIRIIKRQERGYIELPPELARGEEIELFQLRDGYYLLSIPLQPGPESAEPPAGAIGDGERSVLKKLLSIKFENRTPEFVGKSLGEQERTILKDLERKGLVSIYRGKKYVDGVYSIKDSAYSLAQGAAPGIQRPPPPPSGNSIGLLGSRGFMIINDKREAIVLSEQLNVQMKSGAVLGVKGFDGKFYVVTRDYFTSGASKINSVLKEEMDSPSIAAAARLDPEGCMAILRLMAEGGDLIEKKRGVFAPV
ncbi:MAG: hypothetical protein U0R44_06910 [Candidatus Micrarchaeia archaeon]